MSRKLNPILAVQQFFETATLDAAQIGLALAKDIVRRRTPAVMKTKRRGNGKPKPPLPPASVPIDAQTGAVPVRRRMRAAPSRQEQRAPLPGLLSGTVGD